MGGSMSDRAQAFGDVLAMMAVRATWDELVDYCVKEFELAQAVSLIEESAIDSVTKLPKLDL